MRVGEIEDAERRSLAIWLHWNCCPPMFTVVNGAPFTSRALKRLNRGIIFQSFDVIA